MAAPSPDLLEYLASQLDHVRTANDDAVGANVTIGPANRAA